MKHRIHADYETRSDVDIRVHGQGPYFESPHWAALLLRYAIDGAERRRWRIGEPIPDDLRLALEEGATIIAHNASFEKNCFEEQHKRCGWPLPAGYECTAVTAAAMSLPRSLDKLGEALDLAVKKDKEGTRLIQKFCVPRRPRNGEDPEGVYWNEPDDFPEDFARFDTYCDFDVATEQEAEKRLVPLSDYEQAVYALDQEINARGVRIDIKSAKAALVLADKAKSKLDAAMRLATGGYVTACTQVGRLSEWVLEQGVEVPSLGKADVLELLDRKDLPAHVRTALEIRQEAAKSSVSKLKAMIARANSDGRVRGAYMMNGAGTGRWTSTGVNLANMPRPRKLYENAHLNTQALFNAIREGDPDWMQFLYGDELGRPLHIISDSIRGFVWAAPGHDLIQADYSSIEGCVIAWSSGENWKVEALHKIFADPSLPDMYRQTAAKIMNTTTDVITKKHPYRQSVGKVSELALGFGGGVAAFYSMSKLYGVDLDSLYGPVWETATPEQKDKATWRYESVLKRKAEKSDELSREAWIACEIIKTGWRASNPAIAAGWRLREDAVRSAINAPGTVQSVLDLSYIVRHGFLWCLLPSGRCLAYGNPRLTPQVRCELLLEDGSWSDPEPVDRPLAEKMELEGSARIVGDSAPRISAMNVDSQTKRWARTHLYGGLLAENCLSGNTEVLTPYGWKRITDIRPTDSVWDGLQWVGHGGLVCRGPKITTVFSGIRLTPDHKVWTSHGWKRADSADPEDAETASPYPGLGGVARATPVRRTRQQPENTLEPVYDILNAGPLHRFTVRGRGGPIIVANCTQAIARDILVNGMFRAEEEGYRIVAHVYDELIAEVPRGFGSVEHFSEVICRKPDWAEGLPLAADGFRGKRYRKE